MENREVNEGSKSHEHIGSPPRDSAQRVSASESRRYEVRTTGPIRGSVRPPGSKSITNRALVCAALAHGTSELNGALESEDTLVMVDSLRKLGVGVTFDAPRQRVTIEGCGGNLPVKHADLYAANSGTTIRFLTAMVATGNGNYRLDGVERMRQRPIADLLNALNQLGAEAESEQGNGCPPVRVSAHRLKGGPAAIRGDVSSQYLSGLLMAAPCAQQPVEIRMEGPLVSIPYVQMTRAVMQAFDVEVDHPDPRRFLVNAPQSYRSATYAVEPDASAASYFWGAAAVTGGEVRVEGLHRDSLQGDVRFCECLQQMGCRVTWGEDHITVAGGRLRGIDVDMGDISDTVQTLAAVALFADSTTAIRNVGHIRHKETDRIGDLARELRKLGAEVTETPDGLTVEPPARLQPAEIETYRDHRMAMSLALVGLRVGGVVILDPDCTEKTYPNFFEDLERLSGTSKPL